MLGFVSDITMEIQKLLWFIGREYSKNNTNLIFEVEHPFSDRIRAIINIVVINFKNPQEYEKIKEDYKYKEISKIDGKHNIVIIAKNNSFMEDDIYPILSRAIIEVYNDFLIDTEEHKFFEEAKALFQEKNYNRIATIGSINLTEHIVKNWQPLSIESFNDIQQKKNK